MNYIVLNYIKIVCNIFALYQIILLRNILYKTLRLLIDKKKLNSEITDTQTCVLDHNILFYFLIQCNTVGSSSNRLHI